MSSGVKFIQQNSHFVILTACVTRKYERPAAVCEKHQKNIGNLGRMKKDKRKKNERMEKFHPVHHPCVGLDPAEAGWFRRLHSHMLLLRVDLEVDVKHRRSVMLKVVKGRP